MKICYTNFLPNLMFDQLRIRKITISLFAVKNKHKATILKKPENTVKNSKKYYKIDKIDLQYIDSSSYCIIPP